MGRPTSAHQVTAGTSYAFTYGYDLAGDMTSEQYPSGRTITTTFDSAAHVNGVSGSLAGVATTYASSFTYTPHSEIGAMKFGGTSINLWVNAAYNSRLQPTTMGAGAASGDYSKLKLDYAYGSLVNGTLDATKNNGNIQSQTITVGSATLAQSYLYDALNRLTSAQESLNTTSRWTQIYGYDRFANRTSLSNTGTDALALPTQGTPGIDATTNRLVGFAYDTSGNVVTDPSANTFTYDAESHQLTASQGSSSYTYDGDGRRVTKTTGGISTVFVYDVEGRLVAEYGGPQGTNVGTSYLTTDHLGSTRLVTDSQGNVRARHDYMPFGEEISAGIGNRTAGQGYGGSDDTRQKFTSKERDSESNLDYFLARYYSSALGRFTSIDPDNTQGRRTPSDPQSWNAYSCVNNNPLARVDQDGRGFWEKLKNWLKYERFVSNEDLKKEVEEKREWLKLHVAEIDGWKNSQFDKLPTGHVLHYYDSAQFELELEEEGLGRVRRVPRVDFTGAIGMVANGITTVSDTRAQALQEAKAANNVPTSASPDRQISPGTPEGAEAGLRPGENVRLYEYTNSSGQKIWIREDSPVTYPDGGTQGPHFNSGPAPPKGQPQNLIHHHYWGGQ